LSERNGHGPKSDAVFGGKHRAPMRSRDFTLADTGPFLRHVARVVGRYWWIGVVLAGIELAVFFAYVSVRRPTVTAEATLLAESPLDRVLRGDDEGGDSGDRDRRENIMRNHLAVMTSRGFRARLAESLSPAEAEAVQAPYLEPGERRRRNACVP